MRYLVISIAFFIFTAANVSAQDIIVLNGQPNWKKGLEIADYCLFYEETLNKALSFEEVKKQVFMPYSRELRQQKFSNRPLIIQWLRFIVHNTSAHDTLLLHLSTVHYHTQLYAGDELIARSGAYEVNWTKYDSKSAAFNRGRLPVIVPPQSSITYWFRREDRQNQLIPPILKLETPLTGMADEINNVFAARYLFLILAAMTGCFFFIGVYALYHYYLYRNTSFVWYICYAVAAFFSGLYWMDIRLGMFMFTPFVRDIIFSVFLYLVPVLYSFFIGGMLQLPVHFRKGWMLVKALVLVCIFQMTIEFAEVRFGWFPFNPDYYGFFLSPFPIIILNIVLLVLTARSKDPVKWFLFAGISSLLVLWCLPVMNLYAPSADMNFELFLVINFPIVFLLLGLVVEAICFSFALSYRSKLVLLEKNRLQQNYSKQLEEKLIERTSELMEQSSLAEASKLKQVETAFEQKIAETEMTALRAQMNPHFIFNCLNSIKLYTLENDSQTASEYLTMFSQLIRLVLENSRSEKVTLQKELETLRLYIELEAMRFKNKVHYEIKVEPGIDQQYIEIPPLLLQPYVENAIWHGLMHKKNGGDIMVAVMLPAEHLLKIEITDNGVGRELAASYKSKSATTQKSFGLKMTSDRLQIINQLYQINADVKITDMKDDANQVTGTKVIIQIPV